MIEKLENMVDDNKKDAKLEVERLSKRTNDKCSKLSSDIIEKNSATMTHVVMHKN
jgi:hypothetical protein|tara:strand:+ start:481 stop:645 length:165 start_codon:yes stop_codon:yes gene_type:complete